MPLNARAATKTTVLPTGGGPDGKAPVFVKKGTPIGYAVYIMHRRKELYGSDAEEFRPERWDPNVDNEVNLKGIGWGYLPFNGGPRVCIGRKTSSPPSCMCVSVYQYLTIRRGICPPRGLICNHQDPTNLQALRARPGQRDPCSRAGTPRRHAGVSERRRLLAARLPLSISKYV